MKAPDIDEIFLTSGASQAVHVLLQALIKKSSDAVLVPIPQYPLYSASVALYGGTLTPYYLSEEKGWQLELKELEQAYKAAPNAKALVVINPGNPTGAIFSEATIRDIITFATKNKLVIMADEVYRENIYKDGAVFHSFRKVLNALPK